MKHTHIEISQCGCVHFSTATENVEKKSHQKKFTSEIAKHARRENRASPPVDTGRFRPPEMQDGAL
jgi:hypothetical protein